MKANIEGCGVYIDLSPKDLSKLVSNAVYTSEEDHAMVFKAATYNFSSWAINHRQKLVTGLLKQHLNGPLLKEVLDKLSVMTDMYR